MANELIKRLALSGIDSVVIESDPIRAAALHADKVPVVRGSLGQRATYENCAFGRASPLLANSPDVINTNIVLTAREVSERVPIMATAVNPEGAAVLELAGVNQVVLTARRLAKQLASRVSVGSARGLTIGRYKQIAIAEFPIRNTRLAGVTLKDADFRGAVDQVEALDGYLGDGILARTGLAVIAVESNGVVNPHPRPGDVLRSGEHVLVVGTASQRDGLARVFK